MRQAKILGVGMQLPERIVTNLELESMPELDTTDDWIQQRTGIEARHYTAPGESGVDLALPAAQEAIEKAGLTPDDIDFIIYATLSPDYFFPGNGCFLQDRLFGDRPVGALDVRTQCSGFIYSLTTADCMIKSGLYDHILIVGAEIHSTGLDFTRRGRDVTVIFGDGAGAVVAGPAPGDQSGILTSALYSEGKYARELWTEYPASCATSRLSHDILDQGLHYPKMNGRMVFKHAITRMSEVTHEVLNKTGHTVDDIDVVLPHQANLRINQMVAAQLGIPEKKFVNTISWTGNTTAATIPICMYDALKNGRLKENDLVLLVAFGSGFTWAASLIRW
ncbi:MAG: ketoacyl-ACP synthase III [Deltaproteobacteria bacterium]|nr:ketoacyl-ACP synthase III [Deltaproteobacteria bacterium]